tara:strand:+ start:545 stop:1210 length:666 start_codon:yes stop_codon:yes gene_type:complete
MPNNEHLNTGIDLATQAKFSYYYGGTPGYSDGDVLNELYEYFGVIITQQAPDVTLTLPTSGLSVGSRFYLRQISSRYGSSHPVTINLDGSNFATLNPGDTIFVFWTGSAWMMTDPLTVESEQGRIESPEAKSYLITRGFRKALYLNKVFINCDSGSGQLAITKNGVTITDSNLNISPSAEAQYTFSPKVKFGLNDKLGITLSSLSNLEGVHYRIDLDQSSI